MIYHGDLFDVLPTLAADSFDACVTDPPYGIGFMGKEWDTFKPGVEAERIAPNSAIASENPNLRGRKRRPASSPSAVEYDRSLLAQREFQAWSERWAREVFRVLKPGAYLLVFGAPRSGHRMTSGVEDAGFVIRDILSWMYGQGFPKSLDVLKAAYEASGPWPAPSLEAYAECDRWDGWGTALKPSWEPIVLARKPFSGTVAANVLQFGTGALNVDACSEGRWPSNALFDEGAAEILDRQTGELMASRFYYVAKPSRSERDNGTEGIAPRQRDDSRKAGNPGGDNPRNRGLQPRGNFHPTVKPVELMRWLVKLVTPPGGTVLDPFAGSGTTGMACRYELREFVGIEREAEYVRIAEARIAAVAPLFGGQP